MPLRAGSRPRINPGMDHQKSDGGGAGESQQNLKKTVWKKKGQFERKKDKKILFRLHSSSPTNGPYLTVVQPDWPEACKQSLYKALNKTRKPASTFTLK